VVDDEPRDKPPNEPLDELHDVQPDARRRRSSLRQACARRSSR
jgi:hypothetical protein